MSRKIFRARKSEWLLSSFYFFSFFFLLSYTSVFLKTLFLGMRNSFALSDYSHFWTLLLNSLGLTATALLCAIPFAFALTTFLVLSDGHSSGQGLQKLMKFFVRAPLILAGGSVIFWMRGNGSYQIMILILVLLLIPRLSLRWFGVAKNVNSYIVESALSIGMGFWGVLYYIYLQRCYKEFCGQLLIAFTSSLGLITPFLYFVDKLKDREELFSFDIFSKTLIKAEVNQVIPVFILLIFVLSLLNLFLENSNKQYGEWNG